MKTIRRLTLIIFIIALSACIGHASEKRGLADFSYAEDHGLPIVIVESDKDASVLNASKKNKGSGKLVYIDEGGQTIYDGELTSIKGRGNSSWTMTGDQRPYIFKLSEKAELIDGAGAAKKWILLAGSCYSDYAKSNWFGENTYMAVLSGFKLYEEIGGDYPINATPVELYINGDYRGCYILCEPVQIASNRVDISETDGFILELDNENGVKEDLSFTTANGNRFYFKDPDSPTPEQQKKIAAYMQEFEDALYSEDGYNDLGKYYGDYMDIESVAKTFAVKYAVTDTDIFQKSTFFVIDVDENGEYTKIKSGPAWDFDACTYTKETNYQLTDDRLRELILICKLIEKDDFYNKVKEYLKDSVLPTMSKMASDGAYIDEIINMQAKAQSNNLMRWPGSMDFNADASVSHSAAKFKADIKEHIAFVYKEQMNGSLLSSMRSQCIAISKEYNTNKIRSRFVDVNSSDYFYDAVYWAAENGITDGVDKTHFGPYITTTRAQMVSFLWKAAGCPIVDYAVTFSDVTEDAYYSEAVRWAVSEGITKGTSVNKFSPDAAVSRAQAVSFLFRYEKAESTANVKSRFVDVDTSAYYWDAVDWALNKGITDGTSYNYFSPDAICTRSQVVTMMYRDMK